MDVLRSMEQIHHALQFLTLILLAPFPPLQRPLSHRQPLIWILRRETSEIASGGLPELELRDLPASRRGRNIKDLLKKAKEICALEGDDAVGMGKMKQCMGIFRRLLM